MNIPIQIGWPQLILLLIGLAGLWLFITAGLGLLNPGRHLSEEEKEYYRRTGNVPRRRFKVWRGLSGILLLASDNTYLIQGDEWIVQGDIIKFPAWLNIVGLHAGYKLTRLEGRYDDINLENTASHTAIPLNGGDDNFFHTTYVHKQWFAPFVDATYGNAVFQAPGSYDVFATQDALIARPNG